VAKHFVAHYGVFLIGKPVCRSFVIDKFLVKGCFLRCEIRCFYEILFRLLFGTRRAAASVPKINKKLLIIYYISIYYFYYLYLYYALFGRSYLFGLISHILLIWAKKKSAAHGL
jgi:hypothetical protein